QIQFAGASPLGRDEPQLRPLVRVAGGLDRVTWRGHAPHQIAVRPQNVEDAVADGSVVQVDRDLKLGHGPRLFGTRTADLTLVVPLGILSGEFDQSTDNLSRVVSIDAVMCERTRAAPNVELGVVHAAVS